MTFTLSEIIGFANECLKGDYTEKGSAKIHAQLVFVYWKGRIYNELHRLLYSWRN